MKNFTQIPNVILDTNILTANEKFVYSLLLRHAYGNGHTWITTLRITEISGLSKSTIRRILKSLTEKNLISREVQNGQKPTITTIKIVPESLKVGVHIDPLLRNKMTESDIKSRGSHRPPTPAINGKVGIHTDPPEKKVGVHTDQSRGSHRPPNNIINNIITSHPPSPRARARGENQDTDAKKDEKKRNIAPSLQKRILDKSDRPDEEQANDSSENPAKKKKRRPVIDAATPQTREVALQIMEFWKASINPDDPDFGTIKHPGTGLRFMIQIIDSGEMTAFEI